MRTLNRAAAEALAAVCAAGAVHACTDITGLRPDRPRHAKWRAASGVTLEIAAAEVPLFEGVAAIAARNRSGGLGIQPGAFREPASMSAPSVPPAFAPLLFDPQTSGGLLVAVAERAAARLQAAFDGGGCAGLAHWPSPLGRWRYPRPRGINCCFVRRLEKVRTVPSPR